MMCKIRDILAQRQVCDEYNGHIVYSLNCFDHQPIKGDTETFEVELHVMPRCDDFEIIIRPFSAIEGDREIFFVNPVGGARLLSDTSAHLAKDLGLPSVKLSWGDALSQEDNRYVLVLEAQ